MDSDWEEAERHQLRRSKKITGVIREFWEIMVFESARFDIGIPSGCVNREGYRNLHLRVCLSPALRKPTLICCQLPTTSWPAACLLVCGL